jgi:hypothetical protein
MLGAVDLVFFIPEAVLLLLALRQAGRAMERSAR